MKADLREQLIQEYRRYVNLFNRGPSMWDTPSARQEAGRHLAAEMNTWKSFMSVAPQAFTVHWDNVRKLLTAVTGCQGGIAHCDNNDVSFICGECGNPACYWHVTIFKPFGAHSRLQGSRLCKNCDARRLATPFPNA